MAFTRNVTFRPNHPLHAGGWDSQVTEPLQARWHRSIHRLTARDSDPTAGRGAAFECVRRVAGGAEPQDSPEESDRPGHFLEEENWCQFFLLTEENWCQFFLLTGQEENWCQFFLLTGQGWFVRLRAWDAYRVRSTTAWSTTP
jgi:hypothetical protein